MKNANGAEALRRRIEVERAASARGRPRYSEELKDAVLTLVAQPGWSVGRVSGAVGLAEAVIYRWSRRRGKRMASPKLTRVKVVLDAPAETRTFSIELATGAKIVGLTWSEVAMLVRGER